MHGVVCEKKFSIKMRNRKKQYVNIDKEHKKWNYPQNRKGSRKTVLLRILIDILLANFFLLRKGI